MLVDRPAAITIPHWRNTIAAIGDGGHRVLISSPDQLPKLLARNGRPAIKWDIVIADECHLYRHTATRRTEVFRRVARFDDPHLRAPFVIAASATPGQHPAELTYLAPVIAQLRGEKTADWADFGGKLAQAGLPIEKNRFGKWGWDARAADDPDMQQDAIGQVRGWLADNDPPLTLHRAAPWGPAPLELMPVELDAEEMAAYRTLWQSFQQALVALAAEGGFDRLVFGSERQRRRRNRVGLRYFDFGRRHLCCGCPPPSPGSVIRSIAVIRLRCPANSSAPPPFRLPRR